jgi:hypothetical protein
MDRDGEPELRSLSFYKYVESAGDIDQEFDIANQFKKRSYDTLIKLKLKVLHKLDENWFSSKLYKSTTFVRPKSYWDNMIKSGSELNDPAFVKLNL